jgi:hypothetical protein
MAKLPKSLRPSWAAWLALACSLSACSSATFSELPSQLGGLPGGAPERPAAPAAYPAVHDMPPQRPSAIMNQEELRKAEAELAAARELQSKRAAGSGKDGSKSASDNAKSAAKDQ